MLIAAVPQCLLPEVFAALYLIAELALYKTFLHVQKFDLREKGFKCAFYFAMLAFYIQDGPPNPPIGKPTVPLYYSPTYPT